MNAAIIFPSDGIFCNTGCIHSGIQSKGGLLKLYTEGGYREGHNFRPMENSSSKEHRQMRSTREFESNTKSACVFSKKVVTEGTVQRDDKVT